MHAVRTAKLLLVVTSTHQTLLIDFSRKLCCGHDILWHPKCASPLCPLKWNGSWLDLASPKPKPDADLDAQFNATLKFVPRFCTTAFGTAKLASSICTLSSPPLIAERLWARPWRTIRKIRKEERILHFKQSSLSNSISLSCGKPWVEDALRSYRWSQGRIQRRHPLTHYRLRSRQQGVTADRLHIWGPSFS